MEADGVKYDDWGWHAGGEFPPGQSFDYAMVHIGLYFAWIVRRGWHDPEIVPSDMLEGVLRREAGAAVRLMEASDGKLIDDMMLPEAKRFSDAYYADGYLADWEREFPDYPVYGVPDTPATQARADALLDRRYDEWVRRGQPAHWSLPRLPRRLPTLFRGLLGYAMIFGAIAVVAIAGAVLGLTRFPWPLVQVAVVFLVIYLVARRGWL